MGKVISCLRKKLGRQWGYLKYVLRISAGDSENHIHDEYFRKITKSKPSFPNDDSLKKMLYLAAKKIVERGMNRCRNWDQVISHLDILFSDRRVADRAVG